MSIGSVVTRGFGTPGSVGLVPTRGYTSGAAVVVTTYYTAPRVGNLRAEFHSGLTHAKLDYPPFVADGDAGTLLKFDYRMGADRMGTFTVEVPADCAAAANAIAGRELWFYDGDYVVFKGVIRTREYAVDANNRKILTLVGPSITDQLNGTHTGRGLQFESSTLTAGITTLLTGTDFDAGDIDTATIPAREYNDRYIFDAVLATAQAVDCSVRENLLTATPTIDVGVFGESTDITLRNLPESSPSLLDNDYMKQIGSIKVKAQSLDIRNRITPWGQIEGIGGLQFNLARVYPNNPDLVTRLYLPTTGAQAVSPDWDSGWDRTDGVTDRQQTGTDRISSAMATRSNSSGASTTYDVGMGQFIYGPLGEQTIGGNVTGQIRAVANPGEQAQLQMSIRVVSGDGLTVRGTLLPLLATGYGNDFSTATLTNCTFPSTALTSLACEAGDYLVVEVGFGNPIAAGATASLRFGDSASGDLPVDESTTTDLNPWIEFSQFISLGTAFPSGATYEVQSQTRNSRLEYYIEDADSIAQYGVREASPIFKDIFPLGQAMLDAGLASTTLYGMAVQYLQKHTQEQVAYEVEVLGLRHVNPNNGAAFFRPGDTFRLQFDGWTQNADGSKTDYLTVDRDLYILDFTVTYDSAGVPMTKVTLSTFLRAERSDSEIIKQMAKELAIEQVAPLNVVEFAGVARITEDGLAVFAPDGGNALGAPPEGTRFKWTRDSFDGAEIGDVVQGYFTPSSFDYNMGFFRVFPGEDGGNAMVGIWDTATDDWFSAMFVNYVSGVPSVAWGTTIEAWLQLAQTAASNYKLSVERAGSMVEVGAWQGDGTTLTISSGAVTVTSGYHAIDTEGAAASDDLDTINGGVTGMRIVLTAANSARSVVLTEAGNMELSAATITLDNAEDTAELLYNGSAWLLIATSNNGA